MASQESPTSTDKLTAQQMANHIGISVKALTMRRLRGQIPQSVWAKVEGNILYSVSRYENWLESLFSSPPESILEGTQFASGSTGMGAGTKKPLRTRHPCKESKPQQRYVIR